MMKFLLHSWLWQGGIHSLMSSLTPKIAKQYIYNFLYSLPMCPPRSHDAARRMVADLLILPIFNHKSCYVHPTT